MIIVDNGSTDATKEVVEYFSRAVPFPVTYVHESREGHSLALNTGCRAASGDIIVFTDDDAFPDKGWLAAIHDTFTRHHADWVYGPVVPQWETGSMPAWYGPETARIVACLDYGPEEFIASRPEQTFYGVNHAARRNVLFELGLYREDLGLLPGKKGIAGNDDDLFCRALTAGKKIVYQPAVSVLHLIPPHRTKVGLHRKTAALVAENQFRAIVNSPQPGPTLFGLPRYFFRKPFEHLLGWLHEALWGDRSLQFHHELQLIRFVTMIRHAVRHQMTQRRN